MVIGGLAVALLGRPRATRDIDAMVLLAEDRWHSFLDAGRRFGFIPRIDDALTFARQNRVMLLRHEPSNIDVDISLGQLAYEYEALTRAKKVKISRTNVPLASVEDLVILKAIAHRERDLFDIDGLLEVHPELNHRLILHWVSYFADELEIPEVFVGIVKRLVRAQIAQRKRKK
jgi:hypothetical protein